MKTGILTIGNELTSGRTQDTNSSMIARAITAQGWQIPLILSVGDEEDAIKEALDFILAKADAVIVTGGLGPTADDITTACIARAFGRELALNEAALAHIKERFEKFRLKWTDNNTKQALFPDGATPIYNPAGTAWGFSLPAGEKLVIVIPGVPTEARLMLAEGVIPLLRSFFPGAAQYIETRTFKLFGLPEAQVDAALADADFASLGVAVGFYPHFPENHLVITARGDSPERNNQILKRVGEEIEKRLGANIFARGDETVESLAALLLTQKGLTLALAESCTGGLIAHRLTGIPGSSAFLERALVTYSNKAKTELLGVPAAIIDQAGAVSFDTARLMARGARQAAGTDLGLAVTGIAGPDGGSEAKPVGTVFISLADAVNTFSRHFTFRWDRARNKAISSQAALMLLVDYLKGVARHDD